MSYIHLVMPLNDFIDYIKEEVMQQGAYIYLEQKANKQAGITRIRLDFNNIESRIAAYQAQNLNFFISTKVLNSDDSFYDDEYAGYAIEGSGGRADATTVERIALRIISKTSEKGIASLFKNIKNKLKKDPGIGMGVAGASSIHKNYFYQKQLVGRQVFKTDWYNEKAPLITII